MKTSSLCAFALVATIACASAASDYPEKGDFAHAVANSRDEKVFQAFLAKLPKISIKGHEYYVMEGDWLRTEGQVRATLRSYAPASSAPAKQGAELKLALDDSGKPLYWARNERALRYTVDIASFPVGKADEVIKRMDQATKDWVQVCADCGLSFTYVPNAGADPSENMFVVRYYPNARPDLIAQAFFPHDVVFMRYLNIMPEFFRTTIDHTGALRHELGHVLGYRHEHIAGIPGCGYEDNKWVPITGYDNLSVMHYLCGGQGNPALQLTELDKGGHRTVYGRK